MQKNSIPSPNQCISRELIQHNAKVAPNKVVLKFDCGTSYSNLELKNLVERYAANLQSMQVEQGDNVLVWLPNSPLAVLLLLSLNYIGAVFVPINIAYKGNLLSHVINSSQARLMIADGRLLERLQGIETAYLQELMVIGNERVELPKLRHLGQDALVKSENHLKPLLKPLQPWDTHTVIFTSGTTGPSKGVLCSYVHTYTTACEFRHVGPDDCSLVALPMFHIGGILGINFALIHGGCAAVVESFSTSKFWQMVADMQVTTVGLLGAMVQFLMQQPVHPDEKNHTIKSAVIAPLGEDALGFAERFGIDVYTEFNMTELSVPLYCGPNPTIKGTCGKPRKGVELRLVDKNDIDVKQGEIGELIVRTDMPWSMSHGYLNNPQATADAWRNGWFHTGDLFCCDKEDNYFFVDRVKDMIRRRGENISSFEVEAEIIAHPQIKEVAVVAVPGDGGEDEVLAVISLIENEHFEEVKLIEFLENRLAHFMIPRYLRVLDQLPKTPTQKVEKHVLRAHGLQGDIWDRETSSIKIKRQRFSQRVVEANKSNNAHKKVDTNDDQKETHFDAHGPLKDIKIVEFAGLGPVPFCGMLLSDMGADVIRIDQKNGDDYRVEDVESRGRQSVLLDLKTDQGKALALELIEKADILIEGFRPGVMERLGLSPEIALEKNSRLIYGRMTGWGQTGPLAQKAGHDINYLAISGALHALGTKEKPAVPLNLIADFGGGSLYLAMGVLAALNYVQKTGEGQVIDCAMNEGVISMMSMIYGDFAVDQWNDERESNVIDGAAPFYNVYQCADYKWISLAAIEAKFYSAFINVSGLSDNPRFNQQDNSQWNKAHWPERREELQKMFLSRSQQQWCETFAEHDVCLTPVLSLAEAQQHPHNLWRKNFIKRDGIAQSASTPRFSKSNGNIQASPQIKGAQTFSACHSWQVDNSLIEACLKDG